MVASVSPVLKPMVTCAASWELTPSRVARAAMVAISLLWKSRVSRPKMSPNRWPLRNWSMAGAKARYAPVAVGDLFQPCDVLAVADAGERDVGHGRAWGGAVPVLDAGRAPEHIAGPNLLDRPTPLLSAADAFGHDQALPGGMGVPRRPGTRLERDTPAAVRRSLLRREQRLHAHVAGEVLGRPLAGGLRAAASDHVRLLLLFLRLEWGCLSAEDPTRCGRPTGGDATP
jgi:hypothetical protein